MTPTDWIALPFVVAGAFFLFVSAVGLIRLPDFFSRAHAVGKSETLGSLLVLIGLVFHHGFVLESGKLILIVIFVAITNPTGIHTLTRAALRAGLDIWVHPRDRGMRVRTGDEIDAPPAATTSEGSRTEQGGVR
ncbi:MAG: monovalent cation/H(+) antiporter subunit G [Gemmatimonadales bacterium]|nr:MAG: monovalent cation/H(+) antiporter subunit G [Gemmatimonadales bacterium]